MMINNTFRAQCQCGQLAVTFTQAPVAQLICHCRDCQTISGMPYAKAAFFKAEEHCAQGEFKAIEMTGGSGKPKQYRRCSHCNDFVYATVDALTGLLGVAADRLGPPFEFQPMAHVWTSEKAPEVEIPPGVFQFPKAPPFRPGKQ
ncbi:GFA family protein [Limnobacter alexandrii]|uniref:GFA family protein n=1 Tax=Limnobacter alexandrii TaxID=2570352 RepID=UPI0011095A1A|nr:GFA family protein [Limnobacter alexandrii]